MGKESFSLSFWYGQGKLTYLLLLLLLLILLILLLASPRSACAYLAWEE